MNPTSKKLVTDMLKGDKRALARLMTYVDNRHPDLLSLMGAIHTETGRAYRLGVTGPPGAGKSTLVDKLITEYRAQGKTVGVVAIDPSSPFSGGAVLGDRIRMQDHNCDDGVFIRSLGSRGAHGGLSRATRDIVQLLDAYGADVIIIETVGVGQTELDIMSVASTTLVVLVPESGDTIQTMKAGLMEIADVFVVNKADREGADRITAELLSLSEMYSQAWPVPVLKTVALKGEGVQDLQAMVMKHHDYLKDLNQDNSECLANLKHECLDILASEVLKKLEQKMADDPKVQALVGKMTNKEANPYLVAQEILKGIKV